MGVGWSLPREGRLQSMYLLPMKHASAGLAAYSHVLCTLEYPLFCRHALSIGSLAVTECLICRIGIGSHLEAPM